MEWLVIKGNHELDRNTVVIANVCYGGSILTLSFTLVVYWLNLEQLGSSKQLMNHPRKKPNVKLYIMLMSIQILSQGSILTFINLNPVKPIICIPLQMSVAYFSFVFYEMYFSLLLRAYHATKKPWKTRTRGTINWKFSLVAVIPACVVVLFIMECYYTNDKQWSCLMFDRFYIKFFILLHMGGTVLTGFNIGTSMLYIRIKGIKELNFNVKQMLKQLSMANQIRNIYVISIILATFFGMNIHLATKRNPSPHYIVVDSVFHLLLGIHFLVLEWWFHNKEMRKPFKWQRQKDVREIALKNANKRYISDTCVISTIETSSTNASEL